MRISSKTIFDSNVTLLGQQQSQLLKTQQQVASGRRILTAADDPVAAARALEIAQSDATNTQYATNRTMARHKLSLAESNLQGVTSLLQDVRTAVVGAGNGSLNNNDRKTIATELSGRLQELIGLANSTDGAGNYLFAGFQSKTQPFAATATGISYFGDDGQQNVQVGSTRQVASGDSGANVFMRVKNGNGTFATQAAAANTGSGTISLGAVSNPAALTGDSYTISFGLTTHGAAGNTGVIGAASVVTPASVLNHNYSVTVAAGPVYTVTDLTTGAAPAGAVTVTPGAPDLIAFEGIQFGISGAVAGDVFSVTPPLAGAFTVTNSRTGLPVTGMMAQTYVSGQVISFDGVQFDIQGSPADGDTFTVTPSANESVFKTISDLISALNTSAAGADLTNSLNYGLNQLDNALNKVLTVRSSLGLRLNEIDALQTSGEDLSLQFKQILSDLQDVDYNKAISDLTQQQIGLQAAQKSFIKVSELSLFSYL